MSKKLKCGLCGHEWTPRKTNPTACPKCKRYDYRVGPTINEVIT